MRWNFDIHMVMPILAIMAAYIFISVALNIAAHPLRRKLVVMGDDLLDDKRWNKEDRTIIQMMLNTTMSTRIALILPFLSIAMLVLSVAGYRKSFEKREGITADPQFEKIVGYYFISLLAANPLLGILNIIIGLPCAMLSFLLTHRAGSALEASVRQVPRLQHHLAS